MSTTKIKHNNILACYVNKERRYGGEVYYTITFPPDETLKSVTRGTISEVHAWLDGWYGKGEWVAE